MITVIATMTVKPGKMQVFLDGWAELVLEYRKEEGCFSYNVYQDMNYPNLCYMIGQWEDEKAYQKHLDGPHYQKAYNGSIGMLVKEPEKSFSTLAI